MPLLHLFIGIAHVIFWNKVRRSPLGLVKSLVVMFFWPVVDALLLTLLIIALVKRPWR